ncbi:aminotransferase class IV, partial [Trinickia mobilis]|uniref:aminotransferase class IV n=1 Tax=Trinickia mobilis TaxID=2816356 RepID=UPI001A8FF9F7
AQREGYQDAWFVRDGLVTEAASSNVFIVTKDKVVVTRELSTALLPGVLRARILDFIRASGFRLEERAFSVDEAKAAAEAFITNSVQFVYPVVAIDGVPISGGVPGEFTLALRQAYIESALKQTSPPVN